MAVRVLLCDDQAMVRAGFRKLLEPEPDIDVVADVDDVRLVLPTCQRVAPDVVVTETRLRGVDTTGVVCRLCTGEAGVPPVPKVMMLSSTDQDAVVAAALRAGAVGYALKSQSSEELAAAIRHVAAGEGLLAPSVTRRFLRHFAALVPAEAPQTPYAPLSQREVDVLRLLAEGLSNAEIAAVLGVGDATVKSHVSRLLTKLGLRDRVQAAAFAYRSGVVRLAPDPQA
jgi:DNA-binding NarL/FixJ family response regulator